MKTFLVKVNIEKVSLSATLSLVIRIHCIQFISTLCWLKYILIALRGQFLRKLRQEAKENISSRIFSPRGTLLLTIISATGKNLVALPNWQAFHQSVATQSTLKQEKTSTLIFWLSLAD